MDKKRKNERYISSLLFDEDLPIFICLKHCKLHSPHYFKL